MRVRYHVAVSGVLGLVFYLISKNIVGAMVCFFSGFVIDLDHVLDYWLIYGKIDIRRTWEGGFHKGKVYVLLHSFELLLVLLWFNIYTLAFAVGFTGHLVMDSVMNGLKNRWLAYFFVYRLMKGFEVVR